MEKVSPWWLHYKTHFDTCACAPTHPHTQWQGYCLPPTLSPIYWIHINEAWHCEGGYHNYNKWFFEGCRTMEVGGANVRRRLLGQRWCLEYKMNAVIDRLTICTQTHRLHSSVSRSLTQLFSFISFPFFLLTQTNQSTCVLTPKSHSLTCPRVFTSILEGLTSVETNCLIELQHQHSAACLYQLCSFFLITQQPYSPLWSIFRLHKYVRPFTT